MFSRLRGPLGIGLILLVIVCGAIGASIIPLEPPPNPAAVRSRLNGKLVVGIDPSYPPFAVIDGKQALVGYDVDFANALAEKLNAKAEFVGVDLGSIFEALLQRKFDIIISAVPPAPEYARDLRFSQGYFNAGQVFVTKEGQPVTASDLTGPLAVEIGTPGELEARKLAERRAEIAVQPHQTLVAAMAAVKDGSARAAMIDRIGAATSLETGLALSNPVTNEPYVVVARRADSGLLAEINSVITTMRSDGSFAKLDAKWLSSAATPPAAPATTPISSTPPATPPAPAASPTTPAASPTGPARTPSPATTSQSTSASVTPRPTNTQTPR